MNGDRHCAWAYGALALNVPEKTRITDSRYQVMLAGDKVHAFRGAGFFM